MGLSTYLFLRTTLIITKKIMSVTLLYLGTTSAFISIKKQLSKSQIMKKVVTVVSELFLKPVCKQKILQKIIKNKLFCARISFIVLTKQFFFKRFQRLSLKFSEQNFKCDENFCFKLCLPPPPRPNVFMSSSRYLKAMF